MKRHLYPREWDQIAKAIKDASGWTCQGCGRQCRRPNERHRGHKDTLTVHHIDHDPGNSYAANLVALCAPCHLMRERVDRRAALMVGQIALALEGEGV